MGSVIPGCIQEPSKSLEIVKYPTKQTVKSDSQSISHVKRESAKAPTKIQFFYISPLIQDETCVFQQVDDQQIAADKKSSKKIGQSSSNIKQKSEAQSNPMERILVDWNSFIKVKKKNYLEDYVFVKEIGRGAYGTISKVKMKYGGLFRAAKTIKSSAIIRQKQNQKKLFAEIAIPMKLDHPNINKLFEVFEWKQQFVLINELCQGGDLFQIIKNNRSFSQKKVSEIMKQILSGVVYLHKQNIMHRDLKPENILYDTESKLLKIIDFGTAIEFKQGVRHHNLVGTPYYIAPEVLEGEYNEKCDVWSCGVILFILLSGTPPFGGKNEKQIMTNITQKQIEFSHSIWNKRSKDCKNLIIRMLDKNVENRITAYDALNSLWITNTPAQENGQMGSDIISNLKKFHFQNKLKAVVYTYIASQLYSNKDKEVLLKAFRQIDKDGDGVIGKDEIMSIFNQYSSSNLSEQEIQHVISIIDTNGSGLIDFTEFLVAASNEEELLEKKRLENAFSYLDTDHSGYISIDEVREFLDGSEETADEIRKIFDEVDQNGDGVISKKEFMHLLLKKE